MEIGKEQCFLDLITGVIQPSLRQRLLRHEPRSALDIGCGLGTTLVCLHYALGIDQLEGLDRQPASAIVESYNKEAKAVSKQELTSIEEGWLAVTTDATDVRRRITDAAQLRALLNISFDSPVGTYVFKRDSYDLIILSNLLHYLEAYMIEHVFKIIRQLAHDRTLIYVRIKDAFEGSKLSADELLRHCRDFAAERGLKEYKGGRTNQGVSYTFSNI